MTPARSQANGGREDARRGWLLLVLSMSGKGGLSPVQLQGSLFLVPYLSASMFRLSNTGWAWSEDLRRKVKKNALAGLEDAVAWVKEQSYLELMHKTSTIRVIG